MGHPGKKRDDSLINFFNSSGQTHKSPEKVGKDMEEFMSSRMPVQAKPVERSQVVVVSVRRLLAAKKAKPLPKLKSLGHKTPESR